MTFDIVFSHVVINMVLYKFTWFLFNKFNYSS